MKKIFYIHVLILLTLLSSCDLLDIKPVNSMLPVSVEDFESVLLGGYPTSDFFINTDLATDNVYANLNATSAVTKSYEPWFVWAATHQYNGAEDGYWKQLYQSIFYANTVLDEFAGKAHEELNTSKEELLTLLKDADVLADLGFDTTTIMAMFIPNTYQIYWNTPALDLLKRMKKEYHRFWNEDRMAKASAIGLSPEQVITLASIIEEETVKPEEYPVIAGVYINRLNRGIKLDACPTLKFVLGDFTISRILDRYLKINSPYNTYMYAGLPPGPIRMASIKVIDSVLNYQKHDYLYFCAKSDFSGYHNFSKTLRQHNIYAREYHQELNKRKIWK